MENGLQKNYIAGIILGAAVLAAALFFGTGNVPADAQTACVAPPSGMVGWWPGDGNTNDIQGTNHATLQNGATFAGGMVGQGFSLDGFDDYVRIPNSANLNPGTGDFAADGWIKTSVLTNMRGSTIQTIMGFIGGGDGTSCGGGNSGWALYLRNGVLQFNMGDTTSACLLRVDTGRNIADGSFHHVAVSVDRDSSTGGKIFIDGSLVTTFNPTAMSGNIANPLENRIGLHSVAGSTTEVFQGLIDEVEVFDRVLSGAEIQSIYNAASAGKCKQPTPPPSPVCGNSVVESGEQCDDGNFISGDGCSNTCQIEQQCVTAPANMVSWWPGDGTANDIKDGNHGTLQNGATFAAGKVGQAFSLDGVDDRVSIPDSAAWDFGTGGMSIDFWTKLSTIKNTVFIQHFQDPSNRWTFFLENGLLYFQYYRNGILTVNLGGIAHGMTAGVFHHLAITRAGDTWTMYRDGVAIVTTTAAADLSGLSGQIVMGAYAGGAGYGLHGLLDEVEIFNKGLSAPEIQSIYNAGSAGKCTTAQDTTLPETTITSQPTSPTSNTAATFSFISSEVGSTFECQLDGGAFTACTSPVSFSGLGNGTHTFAVRAKDAAGNLDATPASFSWVVDTVAPVATITAGPANPAFEATATFTFTANEQASFECQLDGGAFIACASPKTYTVADGPHIVAVRAIDQVGNTGVPASYTWTVNTSPDRDADGIVNQIDTLPDTSSNDFDDRPLGGTTFGTISSRGGLTVLVEKPVASAVVRVSASGVGTTAVINACTENFKVLLTAGDVADIICGASITADAITTIDEVVVRSATKTGRSARMRLLQGQRGTMADPPLEVTMTAASTNLSAITFEVVDDGSETLLAVGTLDKTESMKVDFTLAEAVSYQVVSGTIDMTIDGTAVQLAPNQTLADQCPGVSGNLANTGCPVGDKNIVTLHNVYLGGGTTSKAPLADARVRVFDRNNPNFQTVAGSKNPDGSLYGVIYEADAGRVGSCTTVSDGTCFAGERVTGDYLVVVKFADSATGKTVYVGRPKSPSDFVDTNGDGTPDLATKDFQIMKVYKKGVFEGYRGGDKTVVTGSMLEMIVPASGVWEGARSLYPFVFNSDSDWTVDVCAKVPQGYSLVGAYNENGDLIASTQCVQTAVANQTKVIAFEVKEVASPEPSFVGTLKVAHKGKVTPVEVRVSDIRKASFEAKLKEARAKVGAKETDASRAERGNKEARLMKVGASLWSIIRDVFGLEGRDAEIVAIGKKVAQLNAIRVPEWGITEGAYDAGALPWGFALDLGDEESLRLAR